MKKILNKIGNVIRKTNEWIYFPIILQALLLLGIIIGDFTTGMKIATGVVIILDSFIIIGNCQAKYEKDK